MARARSKISVRASRRSNLFHRFLFVTFLATLLPGCLAVHNEKIYTRRVPPTKEELDILPPEPYEQALRRQAAESVRLQVPADVQDRTDYFFEGSLAVRAYGATPQDPEVSCEADRIRVLQSRNWADVGSSPPPEVVPKLEPPVEQDPFAPVEKSVKKKDEAKEGGDAPPAEGDKPAADKPAGDMGGDKGDIKKN